MFFLNRAIEDIIIANKKEKIKYTDLSQSLGLNSYKFEFKSAVNDTLVTKYKTENNKLVLSNSSKFYFYKKQSDFFGGNKLFQTTLLFEKIDK